MFSVNEAGKKGGMRVLAKYGRSFYSKIGKNGQKVMRQKYPSSASEWGKLGGRPRKRNLVSMGEARINKKECGPASK